MTKYWVWMQAAMGFANNRTDALLAAFETPRALYENRETAGERVPLLTKRDCDRLRKTPLETAEKILRACRECDIGILTPDMPHFPKEWIQMCAAPMALYYKGNLTLLDFPVKATVVGTREAGRYATRAAYKLSYDLARAGVVIVSGYAVGIDSWAAGGALDAGGKTIAIAGTGLDVDYPLKNHDLRQRILQNGLVISEFPPHTRPDRGNFPYRNRLLAALSNGTILVEAPRNSGALITARSAVDQGKDIYIVPHSIFNENAVGGMELLKEYGYPITCAVDFIKNYLEDYVDQLCVAAIDTVKGYHPSADVLSQDPVNGTMPMPEKVVVLRKEPPSDLDELSLKVYNLLKNDTLSPDAIADKVGLGINEILETITQLEMAEIVCAVGARGYTVASETEK